MIRYSRPLILPLLLLAACVPKRIPLPQQPSWKVTQYPISEHFHVESLTVEPLGPKQARVSGRVVDYTIDLETVRSRREWYYPLVGRWAAYRPKQRVVREVLSTERRQPSSRQITIHNPVGPDTTILVVASDRFETIVNSDDRHFFQIPRRPSNPYWDVFQYTTPRVLELTPLWSDPRVSHWSTQRFNRDHKGSVREIPIWFYDVREKAVTDYVNRATPLVTFVVEDNDTRSPVRPNFQVVAVHVPSRTQLLDRFRREFDDDDIAASAIASAPQYTASGIVPLQRGRGGPNWFSFRGVASGTYRIETRHEDYYYFEGTIALETQASIDKTLLLVKMPVTVRLSKGRGPVRGRIVNRGDR